jgi:hypothetical protein
MNPQAINPIVKTIFLSFGSTEFTLDGIADQAAMRASLAATPAPVLQRRRRFGEPDPSQ